MLTESQFREIADSLRDIVSELKKANEGRTGKHHMFVMNGVQLGAGGAGGGGSSTTVTGGAGGQGGNWHHFERSDHSGPSIA